MRHNPATVYGGKVGAKPRPKRHTISKRIIKTKYLCENGPWGGLSLWLESGHTLIMTINGQTGRYNKGVWECK